MLSRRGFFGVAAGAAAVAAGGVAVAAAPVETSVGIDMAAGADRTVIFFADDWANDAVSPAAINDASRAQMASRFERMQEIFRDIRGQELPPWPYPRFEQNDLTREQMAADLPVIGRTPLPAGDKAKGHCHLPPPKIETGEQYRRRVGTKCPGMLE